MLDKVKELLGVGGGESLKIKEKEKKESEKPEIVKKAQIKEKLWKVTTQWEKANPRKELEELMPEEKELEGLIPEKLREWYGRDILTEEEKRLIGENMDFNLPQEERAELAAWNAANEAEEGAKWRKGTRRFRILKKAGWTEEKIKERLNQYGGNQAVEAFERAKKKAPVLLKKSPAEIIKKKYDKLFEGVDKVVAPEQALKTALEHEKEIMGTLRAHKVEEDGKNIMVLLPRFKKEYVATKSKNKVIPSDEFMKEREFHAPRSRVFGELGYDDEVEELKKRIEVIDKGEIGTAHTHPPPPPDDFLAQPADNFLSPSDQTRCEILGVAGMAVPGDQEMESSEMAYPSEKERGRSDSLRKKEVRFVPKERIDDLMEGIPEERAEEKGLSLLKKRGEKEEGESQY